MLKSDTKTLQTISPIDNSIYFETPFADSKEICKAIDLAKKIQKTWSNTKLEERIDYCKRFLKIIKQKQAVLAEEITWQMGRPQTQAMGEINGVIERSEYMISIAQGALSDIILPEKHGFTRYIKKSPVGTVFVIAPWNYPYLTAINTIIPALLAGNTVILKHASQTAKCGSRLAECFQEADLPAGVFQHLFLTHHDVASMMQSSDIQFVAFTGSVNTGKKLQKSISDRFIGIGLELGGKDAAYVRKDADLAFTTNNLVDGALYNSGQSCCGIERIYIDSNVFDDFTAEFTKKVNNYTLGNPLSADTNLGPVVSISAANEIRSQINDAIISGAKALIDPKNFTKDTGNTAYLAPQVLVNVNHKMRIMTDETFGPVVCLMSVDSDEQAISLINDSNYGLTGSVWTKDINAAINLGNQAEVGTWFMNRCDYLDPALAWTGVKDTGRGITLSKLGFDQLTLKKSFHLRTEV